MEKNIMINIPIDGYTIRKLPVTNKTALYRYSSQGNTLNDKVGDTIIFPLVRQ